jgi:asparagine synthase (glutamine-hydrolysing)
VCGISGYINFKGKENGEKIIRAMNDCIAHRGPDDAGYVQDGSVFIGQRRLSIIDLSSAGHQPMHSANGRYVIVYNGELYNFQDLKFELQRVSHGSKDEPYPFSTKTDTEVILAAYQRWGKECLQRFNGMFAFAIWDKEKKELFIARDRLGIKPLYYFINEEQLLFSSEIRPLIQSGLVEKKVNPDSLADYLRYQTVHAPFTIIQNIFMLMPGHHMSISLNGEAKIHPFWKLGDKKINAAHDDKEQIKKDVKKLLEAAVARRLVADVPFGAFLSGGIDSSAIVGLMSQVSNHKVKTFSIVFNDPEFSEAKYARMIAEKFDTEHHEIMLDPEDFRKELPNALMAMDHPSGDGPNTYVVSKVTKEAGITMALSGLGGDELFAGYDVFKRMYSVNKNAWLQAIPSFMRALPAKAGKMVRPGIGMDKMDELLSLPNLNLADVYALSRKVLPDHYLEKLWKEKNFPANHVSMISAQYKKEKQGILSWVSKAEMSTYMVNTLLRDTDQMSMAHALEVRVPFLDYTLVEYVLGIQDHLKFPHTPKQLLIESLGDLLPSEIVHRPKMGFTFPWKKWMKQELKDFCEEKMRGLSGRNLLNGKAIMDLWNRFLADDPSISWSRIWYLVVLENWFQQNGIDA